MYGDVAELDLPAAPLAAVAWLAAAAGHGGRGPAGSVCNRTGEWIDLDAAAPALLARLADPAAKPAAVAELLELHAVSAAATGWRAPNDDWPD